MRSKKLHTVLSMFAAVIGLTGFIAACSGTAEADVRNTPVAPSGAIKKIFDGKATITLPKGFRSATKEDLEKHAKRGSTPNELFIGTVEGISIETEVLIGLQTYEGTLADMKRFNEGSHKGKTVWERSEISNLNGRVWYVFEMKTPEPDRDLPTLVAPVEENGETEKPDGRLWHHISYFTILDGLVHKIVFTAPRDDMPNAKKEFQTAFDSIEFKK